MGYDVLLAVNGREAIQKAREMAPDVILMDIMMPVMSGLEAVKLLKQDEEIRLIPTVMVTALREVGDRVKALEALQIASLDSIHRLFRAAEYKDEDTGAHIERMSRFSEAVARKMGLDPKTVERILFAAPMHDVGKIGIPDKILLKPGKLDPDEWETMKQHTTIGARILGGSRTGVIKLAEVIAMTHHERWDGTGYPGGRMENHAEQMKALSQGLIAAQEAERRRVARELHDEIGQVLTAVKIDLQAAQRIMDPQAIARHLEGSIAIVE